MEQMLISRIDPTAALPEALAMLKAAHAQRRRLVPTAPRPTNSRARQFRRAPTTRFFNARRDLQPTFNRRGIAPTNTAMASAMLMASSAPRRNTKAVPSLEMLMLIRRRALDRRIGLLQRRFNDNAYDLRDGKLDTQRMLAAQARFPGRAPIMALHL